MTTAVLSKKTKQANAFISSFNFHGSNLNKISTLKKFIALYTDKKSVEGSLNLIKILEDLKKQLPTKETEIDILKLKKYLDDINKDLATTHNFFSDISTLFKDEHKVIIDDPNMKKLIENMKKAKELFEYISYYLAIVIEVNNSKIELKKKSKKYTSGELINLLKAV